MQTHAQLHARCMSAGWSGEAWADLHPDWYRGEAMADDACLLEIGIYVARSQGHTIALAMNPDEPLPPFDPVSHAKMRPWLGAHIDATRAADDIANP